MKSIFINLSLSSFIKPDFVTRGWLVNYVTSLVELFVSIEFMLALKKRPWQIASTTGSSTPVQFTVLKRSSKTN
jgi:hypothetical protein